MKPRLLDLFCGAGGAAMGYWLAGFEVVGVDWLPQPNYPFEFHQMHVELIGTYGFDAIHASPPCQAFTKMRNSPSLVGSHNNLIPYTRRLLERSGVPWVIENVPGAPLIDPIRLCGTSFPPLEVQRHRIFESNVPLVGKPCDHGRLTERKFPGSSNRGPRLTCSMGAWRIPLAVKQKASGIDWMNAKELSQAIPPAFTEYLGQQLMEVL